LDGCRILHSRVPLGTIHRMGVVRLSDVSVAKRNSDSGNDCGRGTGSGSKSSIPSHRNGPALSGQALETCCSRHSCAKCTS
jgi:hypothetical protein